MSKKLLFILFFPLLLSAQNINFPDPVFKAILINISPSVMSGNFRAYDINDNQITIDINSDGEIQSSEAQSVYTLQLIGLWNETNITNLAGIEHFTNLGSLLLSQHNISSVDVSALSNLEELTVSQCNTNNLNVTGLADLKILRCQGNNLTSLDLNGVNNLEQLFAGSNQLTSIDLAGKDALTYIELFVNELDTLDVRLVPNLNYLNCQSSGLSELLMSGLQHLEWVECRNNALSTLDLNGMTGLEYLNCSNNFLTSLNFEPAETLFSVDCSNNFISTLSFGPESSIVGLGCNSNNLSELDVSMCQNLNGLDCSDNQLSFLDMSSNASLLGLNVSYNVPLVYLNIKNGTVENPSNPSSTSLNISNNPNLQYICIDETEAYATLTAIEFHAPENCVVNTYCSFTPGGEYSIFNGLTSFSASGECTENVPLPLQSINVTGNVFSGTFISNSTGDFLVPVSEGTYTFTLINPNPAYYSVNPSTVTVSFPEETTPFTQNFCLVPAGLFNDLEVKLIPTTPARPGFNATYRIILSNVGTTTLSGSVNLEFIDDLMDFVSSTTTPNAINENTLVWNYNDLSPFEEIVIDVIMNINSPMETPAVEIDDQLDFSVMANPVDGDVTAENNTFAIKQTVVGSYDPNDKTCIEGKSIPLNKVGDYVHYIIRFENTGNYHAENIVVKDIINPEQFDITSLTPLTSSHPFVTRINGNKVEFIFENIMLPGLPNDERHGYVIFKIRTKSSLELYETFSNNASIYFDYNHPVVTNTFITTVAPSLNVSDFNFENEVVLYPNPAANILNIKAIQEIKSVNIYNALGQSFLTMPYNDGKGIDVSALIPGMYFIKIVTTEGPVTRQFIKN